MNTVMSKYEYEIMKCASGQTEQFSARDMCGMLRALNQKKLGEGAVQIFLDSLVKKKMMEKKYLKTGFLKWKAFYRPLYSTEFFFRPHKKHR